MSNHKKRRNSALMYEFLVRKISSSLVKGDQKSATAALKVLKKSFKPGTELHRELKLMNALMKTTVRSEALATSLMNEAKAAVVAHGANGLDREKSLLIRNVNHNINDDMLYEQSIPDYRMLATLQTLFNEWRKTPSQRDIQRVAQYEDALVGWLISEKAQTEPEMIIEESTTDKRLLMKVMMKKLNEKYAKVLTSEQKSIIRAYAFSAASDNGNVIRTKLVETRDALLSEIEGYVKSSSAEHVNKGLLDVKERLVAENCESINDETVSRFMLYTRLRDELRSKDDER